MIMKFKKVFLCSAVLLGAFFVSCGSTSGVSGGGTSAYYENNIGDFSEAALDNGIPVVFKRNSGSQVSVVRLLIEGGVPFVKYEKGGLEGITLDLMLHGSQNYSYQKIQRIEYEKSCSISSSSSKDYSLVTMGCIKRDFYDVLDVYADSIMNPLFLEKDFNQEMKLCRDNFISKYADPSGRLGYAITAEIFKNHPYSVTSSVNEKSVNNIVLSDVKKHHQSLLNASRMKFVIVGNFTELEESEILAKLNGYFGSIEKGDYVRPEIPPVAFDDRTAYVECESAGDIAYIEGVFKCPERNDSDYIPYVLASMYVDDSLFKIVREKNSAVYSIGTGIIGARKIAGAISVFKASKGDGLKDMIFEAIDDFPKTEKEVKSKLDSYKNKYITSIFENSQNAGEISSTIVSSLVYRDSATEYLNRTSQVQAVTPSQVLSAYEKYFSPLTKKDSSAVKWVVLTGKESLEKYKF